MAKTQYLTYEIHLNDAAQVAALQATTTAPAVRPRIINGTLFQAPTEAAVSYGTVAVPILPQIGPGTAVPPGAPYMFSEWFTSGNNFPRDDVDFTRKSGGWFGIPLLFGQTTHYWWRAVFVYDAPLDAATGDAGSPRANLSQRLWVDPFPLGGFTSNNPTADNMSYELSRCAGASVDGLGLAVRGIGGVRRNRIADFNGGAGTEAKTWERIYFRPRKLGGVETFIWQSRGTGASQAGAVLTLLATNQIAIYTVTAAGAFTLVGTSAVLVVDRLYLLDLLTTYRGALGGGTGRFALYIDHVAVVTVNPTAGTSLDTVAMTHFCSDLGEPGASGFSGEYDIAFWMGAIQPPVLTGLDWVNGSRAVIVRPTGFAAGHANWTGDWQTLLAPVFNRGTAQEALSSTTALAELQVTTDFNAQVNKLPGALGCVAFRVFHWGHRGTNEGTLGYKIDAAARVMLPMNAAGITPEGAANATRAGTSVMHRPSGVNTPAAITTIELHRTKGNDAVASRTAFLGAVAEVIGTFHDCDYDPATPPALRDPLPELGIHNAPYPNTPWARSASPPLSPVIIKAGTYVGTGAALSLTFRAPVHWLWIRRSSAGAPLGTRWWSTMLGAVKGGKRTPEAWVQPFQGIDPSFVAVPAGGAPTGVGALPDRSVQVAGLVAANLALLDGDEEHKRELLRLIVRELNSTNPGDGNNWGLLTKTERDPDFIPADILVWKPTLEHLDVLTDTGATWINNGPIVNPAWVWTATAQEGAQEQQTLLWIAGTDVEVNNLGDTYTYVAISDPGQRFMLNGAFTQHDVNLPRVNALINTNFLPILAFFLNTRPGDGSVGTASMIVRGPGHAVGDASEVDGTALGGAVDFALGSMNHQTGLGSGTDTHVAFSAFRRDDGSLDPGVANVVRLTSYVGNGAGGTRSINLGTPTGKRPLWALIVPHGAVSYQKDSSHTGGNSQATTGAALATAIVSGAPDEIVVGVTLNTNAVTYNVFAIMGGATGGADGFSVAGEFVPVEPTSPSDGPWGGDIAEPPDDEDTGDDPGADPPGSPGGGGDDMDTDLAVGCVLHTTRLVNIALSRIGVDKQIGTLASEVSKEANLARLHYAKDLESTLRDFPWPFATRYAVLTLLTGSVASPVNRDWTYAYQRPSDCIFERRIVVLREGAVDPKGPPFELSYDNTLGVGRIFTNQAFATLEYTARPECSAGRGDPLFREAFIWKLAQSFAGPLTRMPDVAKHCQDNYDGAINRAIQVIQPGNPGPRPIDTLLLDTAVGALEANVEVVNRALIRIGARTIANLYTEQSREAEAARLIFEAELKATLRDFPWPFATKYETALAIVAGTSTVPANVDWTFAYRYPADAVFVRRIAVEGIGRQPALRVPGSWAEAWNPGLGAQPPEYRIGNDVDGSLFYTNTEDPTIEYTARIPNTVLRADELFRDAFAWRLAASLAPSLAQVDPDLPEQQGRGPLERQRERKVTEAQQRARAADAAWRMYYGVLVKAKVAAANEQQQPPPGDAEWIAGRN